MKRKIRTVQIFIGIVLVFFLIKDCGIPFIRDFNEGNFSRDELRDKMKSSTKEYLSLFTYPAQKEMRLDAFTSSIFISKSQHPILIFDYGGKPSAGCNYLIIIQKVNLS